MKIHALCSLVALAFMVSGCARNLSADTVSSNATVGKVLRGTVLSSRPVTVKDSDKLQDNTIGGLAGGVAGGVAGSTVGKGAGSDLATVGGAIAGAILGAVIEDQLSVSSGTEYIVQLDASRPAANSVRKKQYRISSENKPSDDINNALQVEDTQTDTLAVVQKDEGAAIPAGSRVMIVYYDDRPRVVRAAH